MNIFARVWEASKALVLGHATTWHEYFKPEITVRYPEEKPEYVSGTRGIPALKWNYEKGDLNCTGCGLCARACPISVIEVRQPVGPDGRHLQKPEVFFLDFSRCMVCNLCVEACPFDALEMADMVDLAQYTQDDLVFNKEQLANIWVDSHARRVALGEKL
ncbi:MAG: 4Fe-4S binding protein [Bacillota bacterium]|nr:4Fe-4S binding protein [Bacillota bacterium]